MNDEHFLCKHRGKPVLAGSEEHKWFLEEHFVTCKYCGYNNKKERIERFGTCLNCRQVLDPKSHLKFMLGINC